jgi:hypothetical protein
MYIPAQGRTGQMVKMRTFGCGDWWAWSGAETFADGSAPMIGECEVSQCPATVLAHGPGVYVDLEFEFEDALSLDVPFGPLVFGLKCGREEAIALAAALPRRLTLMTLEAAGFRLV